MTDFAALNQAAGKLCLSANVERDPRTGMVRRVIIPYERLIGLVEAIEASGELPARLSIQVVRDGHVLSLAELERQAFRLALDAFRGNKSAAARALGVGRTTFARKLKQWEQTEREV